MRSVENSTVAGETPASMGDVPVRMTSLVIIIPAYNEEGRIVEAITAYQKATRSLLSQGVKTSIYVVDDGSTDATRRLAQEAGATRILRHTVNRGLGAAVRTGLSAARADGADIAVKIDADLQHDPADIAAIIAPVLNDEAEIVYGNRFNKIEYRMPLVRQVGNWTFTRLMRWMTHWPLRDSQPGIFAASRAYLEVFSLPGDYNYTQQILLDAYHKGMRFAHVDVSFRQRKTGKSFVSLRYPFKVLPQIFMVVVGIRPLRVFAPLGLFFLLLSAAVFCWELSHYFRGDAQRPVQHVNLVLGMMMLGIQTFFFGIVAHLIIQNGRSR